MGLDPNSLRFTLAAHAMGVDFSNTLTLGRQRLNLGVSELHDALVEFGGPNDTKNAQRIYQTEDRFCEELLRHLGAKEIASLDASEYQGATVVQDLNHPWPSETKDSYSLVMDCGTLEHIFNVPAALKGSLEAVGPNGHYMCVVPTNNFVGHGFYQFSPEFFYRVLAAANGYTVRTCVIYTDDTIGKWQLVRDPEQVGKRVTLTNRSPTHIAVLAQRTEICDVFEAMPQQSDYVQIWDDSKQAKGPQPVTRVARANNARALAAAKRISSSLPDNVRAPVRRRIANLRRQARRKGTVGFDPEFFEPIRPTDLA